MTLLNLELYKALKEAGVSEDTAKAAAMSSQHQEATQALIQKELSPLKTNASNVEQTLKNLAQAIGRMEKRMATKDELKEVIYNLKLWIVCGALGGVILGLGLIIALHTALHNPPSVTEAIPGQPPAMSQIDTPLSSGNQILTLPAYITNAKIEIRPDQIKRQ